MHRSDEGNLRVCFISHLPYLGGAERALVEAVDVLMDYGVKCHVILPFRGPLIGPLKQREVPIALIPFGWWVGNRSLREMHIGQNLITALMVTPVALKIRSWGCNVIWTNTICTPVGALAARLLQLPHVWSIQEFGFEDMGLRFDFGEKFSIWSMRKLSSAWVVNSHALAHKFAPFIPPSKLAVIYQSVSMPDEGVHAQELTLVGQSARMRCIIVGTLHERKGQADAIRAVSELPDRCAVDLLIVGDGEEKYLEYLKSLVRQHHLEDHVTFIRYVEHPASLIAASNVLLVCSKREAFGRATIMGMKLGKPVIGTRSGATAELIQDGLSGLLYDPGEYNVLAEKIWFLYSHPEAAVAMAERGRQWASERFTSTLYGQALMRVLEGVVQQT